MTDANVMKSKEPTWEVSPRAATQALSVGVGLETYAAWDGTWRLRIKDGKRQVCLNGEEAMALARFVGENVRKRW